MPNRSLIQIQRRTKALKVDQFLMHVFSKEHTKHFVKNTTSICLHINLLIQHYGLFNLTFQTCCVLIERLGINKMNLKAGRTRKGKIKYILCNFVCTKAIYYHMSIP